MEYISHKIAFSNVIFSKDGEIDAEDQKLNFIRFRNQGTVDVVVNSEIIKPDTEVSYGVSNDQNGIIGTFKFTFATAVGVKNLLITRGQKIKSVVEKATYKNC